MAARALDEKLSRIDESRSRSSSRAPALKGRPPLRECPQDFGIIFVEIGRLDCEVYYRAARITVDRWLLESGKQRLIKLRAQFVEHQRRCARKAKPEQHIEPVKRSGSMISLCLAMAAADWLRKPLNGGWRISRTPQGDYWVGIARRSIEQLIDLAVSRGFDVKGAKAMCDISERLEREMEP